MRRSIYWVFPSSLEKSLDRATWLEVSEELNHLGWQVTLLSADENQAWINCHAKNGVRIVPFFAPGFYFLGKLLFHISVLVYLSREFRNINFLLFNQESAPFLFPLFIFKKVFKRAEPKFILDTRTLPMSYATWKLRIRAKYMLWVNQNGALFSDAQTVITERMAMELKIPQEKIIAVWPSGVKYEKFASASVMRMLGNGNDPLRVIYIGSLSRERNILVLCEAVLRMNQLGRRVTLTLVGDGDLRKEIEHLTKTNNTTIHYIPPCPQNAIPGLLAQAEIGVLPFPNKVQFRVSSPIKLFEYLASGLVVMATRIPCHTDILGDEDAIWVEKSDCEGFLNALTEAFEKRFYFPKMSLRSQEIGRKWTWKESARKLSEGLEKLLA